MLFEMVTGQRPFVKDRPEALMFAIINNAAPAARSIRPDVPAELDRLIGECLRQGPGAAPVLGGDGQPTRCAESATAASGRRARLPASDAIRSIAVLPFRNVSQDPAQEYFADGMTEAIISDLARIKALRVISRTSAMKYKGTELSLPEIARELNVDAVLEGSALLVGNRVRLSVQLDLGAGRRDALGRPLRPRARGRARPAERARRDGRARDRDPADSDGGDAARASAHAVNPEAHLEFLKSRHSYFAASPQAVEVGLRHARRALELDPNARAGLVRARRLPRLPRAPRDGAAGRGFRRGHGRGDRRRSSSIRRSPTRTRRSASSDRTPAISPAGCARCGGRSS